MAHELDITNGEASFVSARVDAWHQLGTTLPLTFTAEEAMEVGHLGGWNVRKSPLFTQEAGGRKIVVPNRSAVLRDNPVTPRVDVLGTVGDGYTIVQNEEHTEFLNTLVDESGAHFETAGALDGGRRVFVTMKLPQHIKVGGEDRVDSYIAAINSHDGSLAFTFMITPVRVVCQNTLNMAFGGASHIFRIRHTSGAKKLLVQQARDALNLTFSFLDGFQAEAEALLATELTQLRFEELIAANFGAPEGAAKSTITRADTRLAEMASLFDGSNAWFGLNAITEWADHFAPTRGEDRDVSRSQRALLNPAFKNQARELMLALV